MSIKDSNPYCRQCDGLLSEGHFGWCDASKREELGIPEMESHDPYAPGWFGRDEVYVGEAAFEDEDEAFEDAFGESFDEYEDDTLALTYETHNGAYGSALTYFDESEVA